MKTKKILIWTGIISLITTVITIDQVIYRAEWIDFFAYWAGQFSVYFTVGLIINYFISKEDLNEKKSIPKNKKNM